MGRTRRVFLVACAASLLAHLGVLGNAALWWTPPAEEVPFSIAARLESPPLPQPIPKDSPPPELKPVAEPAPARAVVMVPQTQEPPPPPPPLEPALPMPEPRPVPMVAPLPVPVASTSAPAPALRQLPSRLVLRYAVQTGEEGFSLGRAVYTWTQTEDRYRLESVAEATGFISLFISGRIHQISEGRVMPAGLQPQRFSQTRGDRRADTAQFNWEARRVDLGGNEAGLPAQAQDLLSFPFHLALTLREDQEEWNLAITNGRRLNLYAFLLLGRETLTFQDVPIETLHVRGARSGEGALDVWLAPAHAWLPIRLRTLDTKGKVITLHLREMER